ncbi:MAG: Spo0B domain-containing protein [Peptococcia bacterium]
MERDLINKMLTVHRIQRHDFMNHLQVIYGYLQLGNLEKAKIYLLKAVESVQSYGQLGKIPLPFLQSFLLWVMIQFENPYDVFEFSLHGDWQKWRDVDLELTKFLMELLSSAQERLSDNRLKCRLGFLVNSSDFSLVFTGQEENLNFLLGQKITSNSLVVDYEKVSLEKLVVIIKG